jgi:hypothetical protein
MGFNSGLKGLIHVQTMFQDLNLLLSALTLSLSLSYNEGFLLFLPLNVRGGDQDAQSKVPVISIQV